MKAKLYRQLDAGTINENDILWGAALQYRGNLHLQVLVWNDATRNRARENKSHHAKAMHCKVETWTKSGSSTVPTSDVAREVVMGSVFYTPVLVTLIQLSFSSSDHRYKFQTKSGLGYLSPRMGWGGSGATRGRYIGK